MGAWGTRLRRAAGRQKRGETLRRCREMVEAVNAFEPGMRACSEQELRALTTAYKSRLSQGETLDQLLPEAFAAVREAARRALRLRLHDAQIMGGVALRLPAVAEMKSGEGKTLTCALAAYLGALRGEGVHVVTVNDYLAGRDAEWMRPVYRLLGMDVGVVTAETPPEERAAAYRADVVYGTVNQFGLDFLRDSLVWDAAELVQQGHGTAIVDETGLVLIEECRNSLGISGAKEISEEVYRRRVECADIAALMSRGEGGRGDYEIDEDNSTVAVLKPGLHKIEEQLGLSDLNDSANAGVLDYVMDAIKAKEFYLRDRDYRVEKGKLLIIDADTRQTVPERRYRGGMHQALEAKEGIHLGPESEALAKITIRGYLRQYGLLAGVTVAAPVPEQQVYRQVYGLDVVAIPVDRPTIRNDHPHVAHENEQDQLAAVADEIAGRRATRQPVLVQTMTAQRAERLSQLLRHRGITHRMVTATPDDREAAVIANAGRPGAVTLLAQTAGQGVNIELGGSAAEREEVVGHGGLYVLGTELYSRRWAEQVRGRAGRQGDPGESRFILGEGERYLWDINPAAFDRPVLFDSVLDEQALVVSSVRRRLIMSADLREQVKRVIDEVIDNDVRSSVESPGSLGLHKLRERIRELYPLSITLDELVEQHGGRPLEMPLVAERIKAEVHAAYYRRERALGPESMRLLELRVQLAVTDTKWREHLAAVDHLLDALPRRRFGRRASLSRYRQAARGLFEAMTADVKRVSVGYIFNLEVEVETAEET